MTYNPTHCTLCPRQCGADRTRYPGYCGADATVRICRADLHQWEEPCISGERGSGTVFFSGCPLHCVFCQNHEISAGGVGRAVTEEELAQIFLMLQRKGAHNINLVTPTQYVPAIVRALQSVKGDLNIPVVYNTGGYERVETLRLLEGLVDVYLPDLKYVAPTLSGLYSGTSDYFPCAIDAITEMFRQTGNPVYENGMLVSGVMVRHLVLPGGRKDSLEVVKALSDRFSPNEILVSLMSQYTPISGVPAELNRRITSFEYDSVAKAVSAAGFDGYFQSRKSAGHGYVPPFHT